MIVVVMMIKMFPFFSHYDEKKMILNEMDGRSNRILSFVTISSQCHRDMRYLISIAMILIYSDIYL